MYKSLIAASMLFVATTTTTMASDPTDWCPTMLKHAEVMLTQQTDSDLAGKIVVPASILPEDAKAYRKLIRRGRFLLQRYGSELKLDTANSMRRVMELEARIRTAADAQDATEPFYLDPRGPMTMLEDGDEWA